MEKIDLTMQSDYTLGFLIEAARHTHFNIQQGVENHMAKTGMYEVRAKISTNISMGKTHNRYADSSQIVNIQL